MTRIAIMASGGFALACAPPSGPATATSSSPPRPRAPRRAPRDLAEIGTLAAECLARAIARGVYAATALPFAGAKPSWRDRWGAG